MVRAVAVAWAVGIFVGDGLRLGIRACLWIAALALALRLWSVARRRALGWSAVCLAVAGGALAEAPRPRAPPGLLGERVIVEGRVVAPPACMSVKCALLVDVDRVEAGGLASSVRARVRLQLHGPPLESLLPGDVVRVPVRLHPPRGFANPGAPDAVRRAAMLGVVATAGVHDPAALVRLADITPPATAERALLALRASALSAVEATLPSPDAGLVAALSFGSRGGVGDEEEERWRHAGVSHVLSVSGLHLSLVTLAVFGGLTWLLLRVPRLGQRQPAARWAAPWALVLGVAYTVLTGAEVATVRAMIVAGVFLGAVVVGRRAYLLDALFAAVLAILVVTPLALFDPSFQLSVAACLGMAWLALRPDDVAPATNRMLRWLVGVLRASLAALAATAPITAWHFSELQPGGLVSNLVLVPLAELVVVPFGLVGGLSSLVWRGLGRPLLIVAGFAARQCAALVAWFSWLPSLRVPAPSLLECALYYAVLLTAAARRRRWAALLLATLVAAVAGRVASAYLGSTLEVTFVDVGQGDAAVLVLPGRKVVVVDGGGSFDPSFDPGREVLAPLLWRRGIRRIDLLVLSHPHPDHANGLAFLVENFDIGAIWTNGADTAQPGTVRLVAAARRRGVPVGFPQPLTLGGAKFRVHGPRAWAGGLGLDAALGENDNSLVLEVEYGGRRLLLSGDVEAAAEARLSDIGHIDVLKVPHHGSKTSSTAAWLAVLRPSVAVISVGAANQWGFPHQPVLARYRALGTRVYRTDTDGAVVVSIGADGQIAVDTPARLDAEAHGAAP